MEIRVSSIVYMVLIVPIISVSSAADVIVSALPFISIILSSIHRPVYELVVNPWRIEGYGNWSVSW